MFDKKFITNAINRSAETALDRRRFMKAFGIAGVGVGAATLVPSLAFAADEEAVTPGLTDAAIFNFALNLEYLEAEFYLRATTGQGLRPQDTTGQGHHGTVTGGRMVPFQTKAIRDYAREISADELHHVQFLRSVLGSAAVSEPDIDIEASFTAAAMAAGLIGPGETFDPYLNEQNFLLGAFIFEDVGVTAYKGAAPLITHPSYLEAAAGILAVEAYHAANIRTSIVAMGLQDASNAISDARDSLDGPSDDDQGTFFEARTNIVPTDDNGLAYSRTTGQVLNIVYLNPASVTSGGFFPTGVNGSLNTSADNA